MSVKVEAINFPVKGRINNNLEIKSVSIPVKGRINNNLEIKSIGFPVKGRVANSLIIHAISIPINLNACVKIQSREGAAITNFEFYVGETKYRSDNEGKCYVYLPESKEVTISTEEGTYLAYSVQVTRPTDIDQGYFEHVITLYKRYYYYAVAKKGISRSAKSIAAKLENEQTS